MLQLGIRGLGIARFKFNPLSWFLKGEQGAWYDPSDLTTLFQDSAGTTPVTAMEQPVGLMLDKSKGAKLSANIIVGDNSTFNTVGNWIGNRGGTITATGGVATITPLVQSYSGAGLLAAYTNIIVGSYLQVTFDYILLSGTSETLEFRGTITLGAADAYITPTSSWQTYTQKGLAISTSCYITTLGTVPTGASYGIRNFVVKQIAGNHAFQATSANRPLRSARTNILLASTTLATQSVTSQATSYKLAFTGTGTVTLSGTATGTLSAGSNTFTATAGTLTLTVSGSVTLADLRPTNAGALLPPYQRVNTASDYDSVGFPLYLKCNGTSSVMSTNSIDFTATDKMTVVTGYSISNSATYAHILNLGNALQGSVPGGFWFANTDSARLLMVYQLSNVVASYVGFGWPIGSAPIPLGGRQVFATVMDGAGTTYATSMPYIKNKPINCNWEAQGTIPSPSGKFGNLPLFIGRQYITTFNGNFYGAIIRGAASDTASVTQTEQYMATKTGITF